MKKLLGLLLAAALLAAPLAGLARAEKIDFGKITCEEFMQDEETVTMLYFWLDGYFSAKSNSTVMDTNDVEKDLNALSKVCQANPGKSVLKVAAGE